MRNRTEASVLIFFVIFGQISAIHAAIPTTPDRPGRGDVPEVSAQTDSAFLRETAGDLEISPPDSRIDAQILNYFGLRPRLEEAGLTFAGSWTVDYSKNFMGGANTDGDSTRNLLDFRINLDPSAFSSWKGATFSIDFQNQNGANGSDALGDFQGFDNTDADGRTQISELWFQQVFFNQQLRVKIGKVDANTEFAAPDNSGDFINSSFGYSPTIVGLPTYPDPATSFNIFYTPTPHYYLGFGVYDGSGQRGVLTGSYGPSKIFHGGNGFFYIAETGLRWVLRDNTLPGHIGLGGHYHDGQFDRFDGGTQSGVGGFYLIADQKIWHKRYYDKTSPDGLYTFAQYAHTDGAVSEVTDHFSAGLNWVAPYAKTVPDSVGIAVTAVRFTDAPGAGFTEDFETSIETYYNFQVTPYLSVKPDLQYIIHPGGNASQDDALVMTIRLTLAF